MLTGCGISQREYDRVVAERDRIAGERDNYKTQLTNMLAEQESQKNRKHSTRRNPTARYENCIDRNVDLHINYWHCYILIKSD